MLFGKKKKEDGAASAYGPTAAVSVKEEQPLIPPYFESTANRQDLPEGKGNIAKVRMKDSIYGALYGLALGDALGGPLEFVSPTVIQAQYGRVTSMVGGGRLNLRPGQTTDDTAMTLLVARGIIANPDIPLPAIGHRFVKWLNDNPPDVGPTCRATIELAQKLAVEQLPPSDSMLFPAELWFEAAQTVAAEHIGETAGNGALMRCLYPALYYTSHKRAEEVAIMQGQMTHWVNESVEACRLYCDLVKAVLQDNLLLKQKRDGAMRKKFSQILAQSRYNLTEMPERIAAIAKGNPNGPTGSVTQTMACALYAFFSTLNFRDAIEMAVNMGGDADTVGSVCGGLAGVYYGYNNLPGDWLMLLSPKISKRLSNAAESALVEYRLK